MKILYRQPENPTVLASFGITHCYLKRLQPGQDGQTTREHHHTGYEIHLFLTGGQEYSVAGTLYQPEKGSFLLIPPGVSHRVLSWQPETLKFGITFQWDGTPIGQCREGRLTPRLIDNLRFMEQEAASKKTLSPVLLENCLLETVVTLLRTAGLAEGQQALRQEENAVLSLAKQYIEDNIDRAPDVSTVAQYCYISTKQLTRLFRRVDGVSPGDYIARVRIARIEALLQSSDRSLKQISEMLHFSSEYYFNTFFKRYAGITPGVYRKMHSS